MSRRFNKATLLTYLTHKLEKQIKKKSERKKSERREKGEKRHIVLACQQKRSLNYHMNINAR